MQVGTPAISIGTLRSWKTTDCEPSTERRFVSPAVSWRRIRCGVRPSWCSVAPWATVGMAIAAATAMAAGRRMGGIEVLLGVGSGEEHDLRASPVPRGYGRLTATPPAPATGRHERRGADQ